MPLMKRILDLKDSHQQSVLSYLPSKRLKTNDEEKENNTVKSLVEQFTPSKTKVTYVMTYESSIVGSLYMLRDCLRS